MIKNDIFTSLVDSLSNENICGTHVQKRIEVIKAIDAFAAKCIANDLEALILEVNTEKLIHVKEWPL